MSYECIEEEADIKVRGHHFTQGREEVLRKSGTIAPTIMQTKRSTPRRKGCPTNHNLKRGGVLQSKRGHLPGLREKVTKVAVVVQSCATQHWNHFSVRTRLGNKSFIYFPYSSHCILAIFSLRHPSFTAATVKQ